MNRRIAALAFLSAFAAAAAHAGAKKETNRQVIDRYFEIIDAKQTERFAEVEKKDVAMLTPMGEMKGIEGHAAMTKGFAGGFPNFKHTIAKCIESGDTIACEGTFSGDHTGPFVTPSGTVPATGKHVDFVWAGVAKIEGGKIASMHVYFDTLSMMKQLGLVPEPPPARSSN